MSGIIISKEVLPDHRVLVVATAEHNNKPVTCHAVVAASRVSAATSDLRATLDYYEANSPV